MIFSISKRDPDLSPSAINTSCTDNCVSKLETYSVALEERLRFDRLARRLDAIWNYTSFYRDTGIPKLEELRKEREEKLPYSLVIYFDYILDRHSNAEKLLYERDYEDAQREIQNLESYYPYFIKSYKDEAEYLGLISIGGESTP